MRKPTRRMAIAQTARHAAIRRTNNIINGTERKLLIGRENLTGLSIARHIRAATWPRGCASKGIRRRLARVPCSVRFVAAQVLRGSSSTTITIRDCFVGGCVTYAIGRWDCAAMILASFAFSPSIWRGIVAKKENASQRKMHKTMKEFSEGSLHSGSKSGPKVKSRKQAIAVGRKKKMPA
jgi:hypothetical protein